MNAGSIFDQAMAQHGALPREWGFSSFGQIGILVDDPQHASQILGPRLGVRNWYRPCLTDCRSKISGKSVDLTFDIVIGYTQGKQIELFSVTGADQGVFAAASGDDQSEIHHVAYIVRDIRGHTQRLQDLGFEPTQTGQLRVGRHVKTRVAYWDMRDAGCGIVELIEQRVAGLRLGLPEWLVRFGALTGYFDRVTDLD